MALSSGRRLWIPGGFICSNHGAVSPIATIRSSRNQGVKMGVAPLTMISNMWFTSKMYTSYPWDLMLCWPRDRSSKERNPSTRRHSCDSIEPEVETITQPPRTPQASETTKKGVNRTGWSDWSWLPREIWVAPTQWSLRRRMSGITDLLGHLLVLPCLWLKWVENYNQIQTKV